MMWRNGEIVSLGKTWDGCVECRVLLDDGEEARALAYTQLVGRPETGQRALLTASAAVKGLGTGGYLMVAALPDNLPPDPPPGPGHIVKARYTPLQYMTLGADEQESEWHEALREADSIDGMPVLVADLHSAVPAAVAAVRARRPEARIAYVMDDGAALPAWFSRAAAAMRESGHIVGTISCGQAFGGQLEAVNVHTALLAARIVWKADLAVVAQGPGNLGTGTKWGFSGTKVGEALNAAAALGGVPIALLRMSNADSRGRHFGLSHHTHTALSRVALVETLCPCPVFDGPEASDSDLSADFSASDKPGSPADFDLSHDSGSPAEPKARKLSSLVGADVRRLLASQLDSLFECERLKRVDVPTDGLDEVLASSPVPLRTMGRGLAEDPLAFLAAGVAGCAAADAL